MSPAPLLGPYDMGCHAIQEYAATRRDLIHLGYSDYRARALLRANGPRVLRATESVSVPQGVGPAIAALIPVNELALELAKLGVYIRAEELALPVHLRASHIGWAEGGEVTVVRPILNRFRIGSNEAIPCTGIYAREQLMKSSKIREWTGPATLFELGDKEPLSIDLGYRPNRGGGVQGIAGTKHYRMDDLRSANMTGARLVDLSTA